MKVKKMKGVLPMCFFKKRKNRQRVVEQEKAQLAREEAKEAMIVEEKIVEPQPEIKVETVIVPPPFTMQQPIIVQTPNVEPTQVDEPAPYVEPTPVVEPKKIKPTPVAKEVKPVDEVTKEKAPKIPKYHVSQNKDENTENFKKWRVRKEGSEKTIKFFDTQKDAIDYASGLAESAGSTVVIHKVDGSIRKQDYVKKP
jgi:hypothetical protein